MNKKYTAVIAATLAVTALFTACTKKYSDDRLLVDSEGNTHVLATDENGETMQDEYGNIVEVITDENGKESKDKQGNEETQGVTYPDLLTNGNTVQNKYIKIEIPEGWEQTGTINIMLDKDEYGAQLNLLVNDGKTKDEVLSEYVSEEASLKESDKLESFNSKSSEVTLGGKKMTKITWEYTVKKEYIEDGEYQDNIMYIYLYGDSERTYNYSATVDVKYKDQVNFDEMVAAVVYK